MPATATSSPNVLRSPMVLMARSVMVAMHGLRRERRYTDRDVLGAAHLGTTVPNPFAGRGDHRLTGVHVNRAGIVLDAQHPAQDDGDLFECGPLAGLDPSRGRHHARHADVRVAGVDA